MLPNETQLIFKAFYSRVIEPSPNELDCCTSLVARGFLTAIKDGHRLGYSVAQGGYIFVQQYFWIGQ